MVLSLETLIRGEDKDLNVPSNCCLGIKESNLKVENYALFRGFLRISSPEDSFSDCSEELLPRGRGVAKIYRSSQTSTDKVRENQTSHINEFSTFLCTGRCKHLDSFKSVLLYAS